MPPKGSTTRYAPPLLSVSPPPVQQDDKHDILSVVDFVDALDALPIELTKGYGDLRELDAVLHFPDTLATLVNLTEKLHLLISLINDKTVHPSTRFQLLQEIAEEAARFKLGGDDKIRVAGGACDGIATHQKHISALLCNSTLLLSTSPTPEETIHYQAQVPQSQAKRANASRANTAAYVYQAGETPTKKKRAKPTALSALATGAAGPIPDDDDEVVMSKAKKAAKEREREKKKKRTALGRALSPTESVASAHGTPALGSTSRHESSRNPRAAASRARYADRAMSDEDDDEEDDAPLASTSKGRGTAHDTNGSANSNGKAKAGPPEETLDQFAGRTARQRAAAAAAIAAASNKRSRPDDDDDEEDDDDEPENVKPLPTSRLLDAAKHADDDGDVDMDAGEVDTRPYCHCGGVSYGEMIGCDDDECEIEWYHLACINLTETPSGTWYCATCDARRAQTKAKAKPAKRGRGGAKTSKAGRGRGD